MFARLTLALVLCFGSFAVADAKPANPTTTFHIKSAPKKPMDLRVDHVMHSLVQIPSAAQPVERGQLTFGPNTGLDPNVFIGAAAFSVLTMMAANLESPTAKRVLCGPQHVGPAILDGGFGIAFAGNY